MNRRKMLIASLVIGAMGLVPVARGKDKGLVGVSMPTKSSARWIDDGNNMVKYLKEAGYAADLQYAEDDIPNQLAQIENLVTKGAKVLVIASPSTARRCPTCCKRPPTRASRSSPTTA
jgi:putative multiple sugar transport system substrate-binding protein